MCFWPENSGKRKKENENIKKKKEEEKSEEKIFVYAVTVKYQKKRRENDWYISDIWYFIVLTGDTVFLVIDFQIKKKKENCKHFLLVFLI